MSRAMIGQDVRQALAGMTGQLDAVDGEDSRRRVGRAMRGRARRSRRAPRGASSNARAMPTAPATFSVPRAPVSLLGPALLLGEDVRPVADPQRACRPSGPRPCARPAPRGRPRAPDVESTHGAAWTASTWNSTPRCARTTCGDLGDRLDGPDLVVRQHHRDQDRAVRDRPLDVRRVDAAVAVDRQLDDLEAELLEVRSAWPTAWCSTAEVTIRWPRALPAHAAPLSARLIASVPPLVNTISRASAPIARREALVRVVEGLAGRAPERVGGRRVAERAGQEREHRLEHLGAQRRRRGMVEVDRHGPRIVRRPRRRVPRSG